MTVYKRIEAWCDRGELFIADHRNLLVAALMIALILVPLLGFNRYIMRICVMIGIYSMLALALNLVAGYTGQLSMGNAGFYAIGAYTSTLLIMHAHISFWIALWIGAGFAAVSGFLVGLPTLRLKGSYLTIVTLGFGEIIRMILQNWESVTNGTLGIRNIPAPRFFGIPLTLANNGYYYLMLALLFLVSLFCRCIINSKIGRAFIAIREDETAACMMGIHTVRYKVLAFVLSAAISGLAGAFYAPMVSYIDPNTFTFDVSSQIICMAILGGLGTMRGMYFGAAVLLIFPEAARGLMDYRFVIYGMILVLMMRYRPQGLLGRQSHLPYRLKKECVTQLQKEGIQGFFYTEGYGKCSDYRI